MTYVERHSVTIETATGGGATGFTPVVTGRVAAVVYTAATGTPYASTADFDVTAEETGLVIWSENNVTASKTVHPVTEGDLNTGTQSTLVEVPIFVANERIKIAIAQGGNTRTGTFEVVVA